jgi:LysM repeat protein
MTRKQIALIVGINTVISAVVTLLLVLLILPALNVATPAAPMAPTATLAVGVAGRTPQPGGQSVAASATQVIHVVAGGDTVSGLSAMYDVPAEDIVAANHLANPNILQVGMELVIPLGGIPEVTSTFTPMPTPTDTPLPFEPPSSETATADAESAAAATAAAAPSSTSVPGASPEAAEAEFQVEITDVIGVGQVEQERIVMTNSGTRLADMMGWTLSDGDGNVYTFPSFRLWGNGSSVTVHTRVGEDGSPPSNFFWGKLTSVWSTGDEATLRDGEGNVVDTFVVGQ